MDAQGPVRHFNRKTWHPEVGSHPRSHKGWQSRYIEDVTASHRFPTWLLKPLFSSHVNLWELELERLRTLFRSLAWAELEERNHVQPEETKEFTFGYGFEWDSRSRGASIRYVPRVPTGTTGLDWWKAIPLSLCNIYLISCKKKLFRPSRSLFQNQQIQWLDGRCPQRHQTCPHESSWNARYMYM